MDDNREVTEAHGCIVCGRPHNMLVIYTPAGRFIDATVTSPGGHRVPDTERPLAACDTHSQQDVDDALARRRARAARRDREDEED